jgi:hypothetical protein
VTLGPFINALDEIKKNQGIHAAIWKIEEQHHHWIKDSSALLHSFSRGWKFNLNLGWNAH